MILHKPNLTRSNVMTVRFHMVQLVIADRRVCLCVFKIENAGFEVSVCVCGKCGIPLGTFRDFRDGPRWCPGHVDAREETRRGNADGRISNRGNVGEGGVFSSTAVSIHKI